MANDINKILNDYINGNEIQDYTLDELENNKLFMEKVLDKTNDIKMYNYCSNRIKSDTGFIRFLIKKFRNNLDFLSDAVDFYFDNTTDEDHTIEITIIMRELLKGKGDDRYQKFELMRDILYTALRLQVEQAKYFEKEDYKFQSETGLGFWYIFDLYKNNEIVTNFYAKKMINEIFIDDYYALDKILHKQYSSIEELEEKGIYNVLIDVIRIYDDMLADYICVHKPLLKDVLRKYKYTIKRWDKYVDFDEIKKFDKIDEEITNYIDELDQTGALSIREIETLAGIDLGIEKKLIQYQIIDKLDIDIVSEDNKDYSNILKYSFIDKMIYRNIKNIMKSVIFDNKKVKEINENKCKILNLDNYRKDKSL